MEQKKPLKSGNRAVINPEKCKHDNNCLKCMEECKTEKAISQSEDGSPVVDLDACDGCGNCAEVCPNKAIGVFYLKGTQPDPPRRRFEVW